MSASSPRSHAGINARIFTLMLLAMLCLYGCGGKQINADEATALNASLSSGSARPTIHLPADDGKPLTSAELAAITSVGDFDRTVSGEDMRDVLLHFKYLVHQGRRTVEKSVERGELYLPHIRSVLRQKQLPQDLAYLPFIESGYDTRARSRTGALGMWQFVKGTGSYYGMKRDWWSDERHCPYQSTEAATIYLAKLNGMFNDWHLAITSYNAGEGRISRAAEAVGTKNFFELRRRNHLVPEKDRLSDENLQYLPKFLAVCKIMRNLSSLGFREPDPRRGLQVSALDAKPSTDLVALSRALGMSWNDFLMLNPVFLRYISPPDRTMTVYVPSGLEASAREHLRKAPSGAGWKTYTVQKGDTFQRISSRTGIPVRELRRVNPKSEPLKAGSTLRIPGHDGKSRAADASSKGTSRTSTVATVPSSGVYTVRSGDTVYGLSRAWGVSAEAIVKANGLASNTLSIGQQLRVPAKPDQKAAVQQTSSGKQSSGSKAAAKTSSKAASQKVSTYKVQSGDTVWGIARKFNMSPDALMRANNLNKSSTIRPGDTLRVVGN